MPAEFLTTVPVLPSADIERDLQWYGEWMGFQKVYADRMYAVIRRNEVWLHLQWHADTPDDPLLGGSVVRIFAKEIAPLFEEFVGRGTVARDALRRGTPWGTDEFGVRDPNNNIIFLVQDKE